MSRGKSQLTALDHLILSIFQGKGKRGVMSFVTVHFDDSGTHTESQIAIAACYAAHVEHWKKFERGWNRAKKNLGFNVFHMADFAAGHGEFTDWSDSKKRKAIKRLCRIVNNCVEIGYGAAVQKALYDSAIQGDFRREFCGDFHYTFAVRSCATSIGKWRRNNRQSSSMKYIFDQMGSNHGKGEIMKVMDRAISASKKEAVSTGVPPLTGYSFESKATTLPLQAADIFAWTAFQQTRKRIFGHNPGWIADLAWQHLSSFRGPFQVSFFTREQLELWLDEYLDKLIELAKKKE